MESPRIELAVTSPVPLYCQLADRLRSAIATGELGDGAILESSRALSERLGISRDTVIHALRVLISEGRIVHASPRRFIVRSAHSGVPVVRRDL